VQLDPYVWRTARAWAFLDQQDAFEAAHPPWHDPRADDEVDFPAEGFVAPQAIRNPPRWWKWQHMPPNWFRAAA
jgi:hypothetical protein